MNEGLDNISIARIKELNFSDVKTYGEELAISNNIDHLSIFKNPCRIDGVVVFVCLDGCVTCNVDIKPYRLTAGDMLVNFNSSTIQADPCTSFRALAAMASYSYLDKLHLDLSQKLSLYMGVKSNAVAHISEGDVASFADLFNLIERNIEDSRPGQDAIMDGLIQMLGRLMVWAAQSSGQAAMPARKPLRSEQIFERFMELVAAHHGTKRSASYYANEMGLTPNYLSNMVKTCSGRSSAEWINEHTVSEAKVMLRFSDLSVQQVASKLNFPSQSAFGKFFKQHVGVNPNQFRRDSAN